ncbi:MAG: acyltransferase [Phycisphaerae bacterium]|nr:acyltransferase [Phycisphaerae bacterium]
MHAPPAPTAHDRYLKTRYFAALDGLRCLSILWVIGFHAHLGNSILFRRGDWGVGLFFAISGFLITTLLLREKSGKGEISLKDFYARRTLRIFPLYYAAISLYTLLVFKLERGPERSEYFHHLPFFLTYTGNWFVDRFAADRVIFAFSWTLATEEQFYLIWPSIIRFARRELTPLFVILAAFAIAVVFDSLDALGHLHLGDTGNRIATSIATPICLGCVLAYALHFRRSFYTLRSMLGSIISAPTALLAVVALYIGMIHAPANSRSEF